MNLQIITTELLVLALGLLVLVADLWLPAKNKAALGYSAAAGLLLILAWTFFGLRGESQYAFEAMYVLDPMALFFKRFFLLAAILVMLIAIEFSDRVITGHGEYYSIMLFALLGMLFAASANHFALLFVSLELITVSFYVLVSFQRTRLLSLEAGVKYLIIGALSTGFTVFGIALVFGVTGAMDFPSVAYAVSLCAENRVLQIGLLFVLVGLGFKIAAVPVQIWAPDVYQGAPTPTAAFLAVGSKAAGFALLLRVLLAAAPDITARWSDLLIWISAATILYGNLCAIPQRNVKRLLGYSSIAHAGYLLMGLSALSAEGLAAMFYYLVGYLFTVLAAFAVICVVLRHVDSDDIFAFTGLQQRSPLLATGMVFAMVSLAGIPPLAGFLGKFLLIKAVIAEAPAHTGYYCLAFTALAGVIISIYYYFGVVRAVYTTEDAPDLTPIHVSMPARVTLAACMAGILFVGLYPSPLLAIARKAAQSLAP
jgi:NADH-quinone oxidoreductase subunit N